MEYDATIERVVKLAFWALVDLNYFPSIPTDASWLMRWDNKRLSRQGFRAAATADGLTPVMLLATSFTLEQDIDALIHESIHLAQIMKGDLVPGYGDGTMIWKGKRYPCLPAGDKAYLNDQPWEAEAAELLAPLVIRMARSGTTDSRDKSTTFAEVDN